MCFTHIWVWYVALLGLAVSACQCGYGEPVCPNGEKTIKWRCPEGEHISVQAFWGREAGDDSACVNGKSEKNRKLRTQECLGDDQKAIAAVTEWCDANVNQKGECIVKAPKKKLNVNGKKYDPCPKTMKYLKVCSECVADCLEDPVGVILNIYNHTRGARTFTTTSKNDLAIVWDGAYIVSANGDNIVELTKLDLPESQTEDIARHGCTLFILGATSWRALELTIFVMKEDGTYVASMGLGMTYTNNIAVAGNKIYVTGHGILEITFDNSYKITNRKLLVEFNEQISYRDVHVTESQIVVISYEKIYYFYRNGTEMFPPVQLDRPTAFALDRCGRAYVLDANRPFQIQVLSNDGKYIGELELEGQILPFEYSGGYGEKLPRCISSIYVQNNYMYVGCEVQSEFTPVFQFDAMPEMIWPAKPLTYPFAVIQLQSQSTMK